MRKDRDVHISDLLPLLEDFSLQHLTGKSLTARVNFILRGKVFERDQGVCALCGISTQALWEAITWYDTNRSVLQVETSFFKSAIGRNARRWPKQLWEMDHIIPICRGGALCDLKNLRTLCLDCHAGETKRVVWRSGKPMGGVKRDPTDKPIAAISYLAKSVLMNEIARTQEGVRERRIKRYQAKRGKSAE